MDIFEFCVFYIVSFTALFSLTPLGTFPPRDISFTIPGVGFLWGPSTWSIPWLNFIAIVGITGLVLIITIVILGDVTVAGSGPNINTKYLSTIVMGFIIGGGVGISMTQMMPPDMPLIAAFFLVWIWVILLVYSIVMWAGAGG